MAFALASMVVAGVVAWLAVDAWRTETGRDRMGPEFVGGVGTEWSPGKVKGEPDSTDRPRAVGARSDASTAQDRVTIPVQWATLPEVFPDDGFMAVLERRGSGPRAMVAAVFSLTHVELEGPFQDGEYVWQKNERLLFPSSQQLYFKMSGGTVSLAASLPFPNPECITVFYSVNVLLVADLSNYNEGHVAVAVSWRPTDGFDDEGAAFVDRVRLANRQKVVRQVPRGPLVFRLSDERSAGGGARELRTSLENRFPVENEVIELEILGDIELHVRLIEQASGALTRLLAPKGEKMTLDKLHMGIELEYEGNDRTNRPFRADWLSPPVVGAREFVLRTRIPAVSTPLPVAVRVVAAANMELFLLSANLIAIGNGRLEPVYKTQELAATVIGNDWEVAIDVIDTLGALVPDYTVSIRVFASHRAERRWLGAQWEKASDESGRIRFSNLPSLQGIGVSLSTKVPLKRDLNPDVRQAYWYDAAVPETRLTLVVDSTATRVLIFRLEVAPEYSGEWTPRPRPDGGSTLTPIPYLVLPDVNNRKLATDVRDNVSLREEARLFTAIHEPGRYNAILFTPAGVVTTQVRHGDSNSRDHSIPVDAAHEIDVRCWEEGDRSLDDAIIFVADLDEQTAWALAMAERKGFVRMFRRQTTRSGGKCRFNCQPVNLRPTNWLVYHADFGLFRPKSITGSVHDGFELRGVTPVEQGAIEVRLSPSVTEPDVKYIACVTPIFCEGAGGMSGMFAFLGRTEDIVDGTASFSKLPTGRYAVSVIKEKDGLHQVAGSKWAKIQKVDSGSAEIVPMPAP